MRTELFNYNLPEELIAQTPPTVRGTSRMMLVERSGGKCTPGVFSDLPSFLKAGDLMVFNNTKVIRARFFGIKAEGNARIELLLTTPVNIAANTWKALIKPGKRTKPGTTVRLLGNDGSHPGKDAYTVLTANIDGEYMIKFNNTDFDFIQQKYGHVPLPPYIKRPDVSNDDKRYQTVFASEPGAVAAPTAGLHFTQEIIDKIKAQGVSCAELTLHVGAGTFKPVSVEDTGEHKMHSEIFSLSRETAELINKTHASGGRVLAIGTTTVRVLETCVNQDGTVKAQSGATDIFLFPPYKPRAVDMLLTNFHLPKSTLLMLVSCFADREKVLAAYELAIKEKFRFYSYGDCMLLA